MRSLGSIPREDDALRLCDYLLLRGIESRAEGGRSGWEIWVRDEDRVEEAGREFDAFVKAPQDAKYRDLAGAADAIRRREAEDLERHARNRIDVRAGWAARVSGARPFTMVLAAAAIAAAILTELGRPDSKVTESLRFGLGGKGFEQILSGEVWRLFSHSFLHFSALHLIFNLFWLYDLGGQIERVKGRHALLLLFVAGSAISGIAQCAAVGPYFGGLSGVNYALFGYVWMRQRYAPHDGLGLGPNTVLFMLGWLVLGLGGILGPVANVAHVAGLAVGLVAGAGPHFLRRR